jgi:tetratricopeptide (TPR) repeat protein
MRAAIVFLSLSIGWPVARADGRREVHQRLRLAGLPSLARDDEGGAARAHYQKATTSFELQNFDEAIREYTEAYKLKSDPALLYNLGQAHRLAQHPSDALHFYKMYLSKSPEAPNRTEVIAKIEALQKLIEQQKAAQALPPDQPLEQPPTHVEPPRETQVVQEASAAASTPPVASAPASTYKTSEKERAPSNKKTLRYAGLGLGGGGLAIAGLGAVFAGLAKVEGDAAYQGTYNPRALDRQSSYQTAEIVCFAIGGAAVVAGVTLFAISVRK